MTNTDEIGALIVSARAKAEYMRLQGMYRSQEEWQEFADRLAAIKTTIAVANAQFLETLRHIFEEINDDEDGDSYLNLSLDGMDAINEFLAQLKGSQDGMS